MARRTRDLSFAEFGQQFIERAVTPEMIGKSLAQIVPTEQRITLASPTAIAIDARTTIGDVARLPHNAAEHELIFDAPLAVHLSLAVDMLVTREQYAAVATTCLRLIARTRAPLTIYVDCMSVTPEQIAVASEGQGNWFDLVKRFGMLDAAIRQQVARIVNQHIEASRPRRTIDVRKLIASMADTVAGGARRPPKAARASGTSRRRQSPAPADERAAGM